MLNAVTQRVGAAMVGLTILGLSACSTSDGGASGPATLTIAANYGSPTTKERINKLVSQFEAAHPKIKVKVAFSPVASFDQVLGTQIQSGNEPDIVYGTVGSTRTSGSLALAKKGVLLDVTDQPWASQVPSVFKNLVGIGDKLYAWPQDVNFEGTIYNTATLRKVGVQPPRTWSDVLDYCTKMKAAGITPYTMSLGDEYGAYQLLYSLAATTVYAGNPSWDEDRARSSTTFASTPGWAKAMNQTRQLKDAGCFDDNATSVTLTQAESQLARGKAGGYPILSIVYTAAQAQAPKDTYAFVPFPAADGGNWASAGALNAWSIMKDTSHRSQALAWLKFVADPRQNRALAAENGAVAMVDYSAGKVPGYFDPQFTTLVHRKQVADLPLNWPSGVQDTVLGPGMQSLFLGKTSVPSLLDHLDSAWKEGT